MEAQLQLFGTRRGTPKRAPRPGAEGEKLRDEGISRVTASNGAWSDELFRFFAEVWLPIQAPGFEFIGEAFRRDALAVGLPQPTHPNAWGALFSRISRSGLVVDTGRTAKMEAPDSHARRSPVYRKP